MHATGTGRGRGIGGTAMDGSTAVLLPIPRVGRPVDFGPGCDCTQCAFWMGPDGPDGPVGPATVEPICSGSNADCSYCGCARAEADAPQGGCRQCPVRCSSRTDRRAWLADVGGTLLFDDLIVPGDLPAGLPRFIPMTDGSAVTDLDQGLDWPAYGVGLRRVFSPRTHTLFPRFQSSGARDALGLRADQLAVLVGYGEDPLVEAFWTRRHSADLIGQIAAQGWDLVLAPNYSIYGNWPRAEHLLNCRRALLIAAEFAAAGVCAVPNVYWFRLEDLKRYVDWIHDTPPPAIAINLQTVRENTNWASWAEPGLHWLAANIPPALPVILTGLSRTDRITSMQTLFGDRLHVVSQNAYQYALHGAVMTVEGRRDVHAQIGDAFRSTVRYMASLLDRGPT